MAGKIQKQDVKTSAELAAAGAADSSMIQDTQIYVTANSANEQLASAIADGKVVPNATITYAKIQDISAASKLLGRGSAGGSGVTQEITLGTNLSMSGTTLNASSGSGDVSSNTSTSVDSEIALFNGTTGKSIKRATGTGIATVSSGVFGTIAQPSGTVVGTTDTQTLQNKTIDNTSTITVKDANFTIQDDGDTTKQAKFQASGITTGTTRTYTLPDASTTLDGATNTATLQNKTLDNTNSMTIKDANLVIQDDGDTTKQFKIQASGITTGTTRTMTVPDADFTAVGIATTQTLTNKTLTTPTIADFTNATHNHSNAAGGGTVAIADTTGTLAVGRGGTGATSLTVHGVVIGNSTSAVNVTSAGTSGQVLTSNGAGADPTFQAVSASAANNFQEFTASGSWVAPTGVTQAKFKYAGGGGGGGSGSQGTGGGNRFGGGGGAGATVSEITMPVTAGATYTITIGSGASGGAGSAGAGNAGSNGGNTTITGTGVALIGWGGGGGGGGGNTNIGAGTAPTAESSFGNAAANTVNNGGCGGSNLFLGPASATANTLSYMGTGGKGGISATTAQSGGATFYNSAQSSGGTTITGSTGGGGGGTSIDVGGNGGNGTTTNGQGGGSVGTKGSGGGGSAGLNAAGTSAAGSTGGNGYVLVSWIS